MILDEIIKEAGEEKCEDRVLAWASIKKLQCKEEFGKEDKKGGQLGSRRPQEKDILRPCFRSTDLLKMPFRNVLNSQGPHLAGHSLL